MRCAVGCGHVHRGVDIGVGVDVARGDPAHPTNEGLACGRGIRESTDPEGEWLTRPMVRRGDELVPTTWDVALGEAINGLRRAAEDDPDAVAVLGSGQQTNEAAYALGKLARGALGTRNYGANTTLCMASAVAAYYDAFGSDAPPPTYDDVPDAETHLVWGANPAVAHPVMFRWIHDSAGDDDSELIVVDPVETKTAGAADHHVAPDPGTDLALARAVLARLVADDGVDRAFVDAHTEGFDDLLAVLPDAADAAAEAGVDLADVDLLCSALDAPTLLYWGMGVNQHVQGTDTASALVDLCLASGNLGPGSGPFSLTGQANSMGTRVCSSKGTWPGHRDFDDPTARRDVASAWGVPVDRLPDDPGPGPVGMLDSVGDEVEAIYAVATNPAAGMPDATAVREALDEAFLVVQDAFSTETTELADVVLPAATWGESEGTTTNMERTISRVRRVTDPPSGVRTDLDLIATVGEALEPGLFPSKAPAAVFEEFAALTRGTLADCSGISYERLDEEHAVRWPAPDASSHAGYRYYDADADPSTGDERWSFPTPSGRARFSAATFEGVAEPVSESYPLTLTTAREGDGYNTGVRSRSTDPDPATVRVHPESAPVGDGEAVEIESRRGAITATLAVDAAVPEGVAWLPIHHPATNVLTTKQRDPTGEPNFKQCAVRLEPVEVEERVREEVPA
ncbi:molybdopterin-dependent oxidoreductase [Natronomonas salina]|uniref:assimilatory nitrate reductase NasA n=1 Tax=Natronomonas salina TaxID=1710540 RepID=UPI0015B6BE28|nr:assimilatory nitrate reductase NasA [Natronomonas salina]QLD91201.1 molybdopterin-dependent oxidoreductase [Natronomonas salina]